MILTTSVFALVGTVALAVCVVCLIILHIVPSGLLPMRDPVRTTNQAASFWAADVGMLWNCTHLYRGFYDGCEWKKDANRVDSYHSRSSGLHYHYHCSSYVNWFAHYVIALE